MAYLEAEPREIAVDVPVASTDGLGNPAAMMTSLFAEHARLQDAHDQMCLYSTDIENMSAFFAACSIGALERSFAGIHAKSGVGGRLDILGYDSDFRAVRSAVKGQYVLPISDYMSEDNELLDDKLGETAELLSSFGLEVDTSRIFHDPDQALFGGRGYRVNGVPIQRVGRIDFGEADLMKGIPERRIGTADLVQATGVIYNFAPENALDFLVNVIKALKEESGVLNLGEVDSPESLPMGGLTAVNIHGDRQISYADWLGMASDFIRVEYGLEPVVYDRETGRFPVIFARG